MTQKERELYSAYVYNMRSQLEDDIKQLQANIRWRKVSVVDCLELIIAQTRYDDFCEFVHNMNGIINCNSNKLKVNFQKDKN